MSHERTSKGTNWPVGDGEMAARVRAHDWAATTLGPSADWPQSLRTAVDLMLDASFPTYVWWGRDLIQLYNDSAIEVNGSEHLAPLGMPARQAWAERWDAVGGIADRVFATGRSERHADLPVILERDGASETAWFTFSYGALRNEAGIVSGLFVTGIETTERVRAEAALRESETRHRLLVGTWAQAVWETDAHGVVVVDSPSWRAHTGQTREQRLGDGWLNAIHPDDRARAEKRWKAAVAAGGVVDAEFRLRAPDGGWRWTHVRAAPVLDAGGKIEKWVGMNIDIDASRRAESSLIESEARYRTLFESMDEGYLLGEVIFDGNDKAIDVGFLEANPAAVRLAGRDFAGRRMREIDPQYENFWYEAYGRVASTGESLRAEHYAEPHGRWFDFRLSRVGPPGSRLVASVFQDITERKNTEEKFRAFFDATNVALVVLEFDFDEAGRPIDFRHVHINPALEGISGFKRDEILDRRVTEMVPAEEAAEWIEFYAGVLTSGIPNAAERFSPAMQRWIRVNAAPFGPGQVAAVFENTTARRLAEAELRESEEQFRRSVLEAPIPVIMHAEDGEVLQISRSWTELTGYTIEDSHIIQSWLTRAYGFGGEGVRDAMKRAFAPRRDEGPMRGIVFEITTRQGVPRQWSFSASSPGALGDGRRFIIGMAEDITERIRAEAALRASEEQYRDALDSMSEGFALFDADFTILDVNAETVRLDGRTREELVGRDHWEAFPGSEDSPQGEMFKRVMRDRVPAAMEHSYRWPDGKILWMDTRAYPTSHGRVGVLWRDITERRQAEEALRESEARFRAMAEQAVDYAIFTIDAARRIDSWQPGAAAVFGWSAEEAIGRDSAMLWTPEDRAAGEDEREFKEAQETGMAPDVRWHLRKDGSRVFIDGVARSRRGPAGEIQGTLKIGRDMSDRHRAEQTLRESEERFRQFGEASTDILWIRDAATLEFEYVSPAFETIYGRARDQVERGIDHWTSFLHPDDRERVLANFERVRGGERITHEFRILRPDGELRWLEDLDFPLRGEAGRITRIGGIGYDITAGKRAADALRESEERFRSFADASEDVLWIVDAATRRLEYVSPAYERIWGESREAIMADLGEWAARIHPDDLPAPGEGIEALLAGRSFTADYRVLRRDGTTRFIRDTGFPIFDEQGRVRRVAGVAQDLTDRRIAERALAENERRTRTLMEGIPQLVWRSFDEGHWTWSSPQWQDFTGQSLEQSRGLGWLDALHPDDREAAMRAWKVARPQGLLDVEYRVRRASDGAYLWHHTRSLPVRDDAGRILEWLGTTTDVQVLKQLQERQEMMVAELQHRTRNLIAVVQSIAHQTMAQTGPTETFRDEFDHRLEALARVQGLLSRSDAEPITIEALIRMELDALGAKPEPGRIHVHGPDAHIRHSIVQTLALALHELATNARKYGALSTDGGRLDIRWRTFEDAKGRRLALEWAEVGGQPPRPRGDARRGYGRELIEKALPYSLNARTSFEHDDAGLRCNIDMPLERNRSQGHAA